MNSLGMYRVISGCFLIICMSSYSPFSSILDKKPKRMKPDQYTRWVESLESGLTARKTSGNLDFGFLYRPLDYIVLKERMSKNEVLTRKYLENRKKEIEGMEYYTFSISMNDGRKDLLKSITQSRDDYEQMLLYFANQMQEDLKLAVGKDTIDCKLFHFERTYGITPYARFVLGFESCSSHRNRKNDRTLLFFSNISDKEVIKLHIRKEDIYTIPKIIFKD